PYERLDYGRGFAATDTDEYLAINPAGLVPALKDGDFVLGESNAIIRYLCVKAGHTGLLPDAPQARARIEQWMDWQSAEMTRPFRVLFMGGQLNLPPLNTMEHQSLALAEASKFLGVLDAQLEQTGAYIIGDEFTAADLAAGMYVHRWFALDIARPELPSVTAYYERLQQRVPYQTHVTNGLP
ncbi:MAG: glutathione S-transferase family protein, partial [Pseudomonadota bacterium]